MKEEWKNPAIEDLNIEKTEASNFVGGTPDGVRLEFAHMDGTHCPKCS